MTTLSLREQLQSTLHKFRHGNLRANALALLEQLGYSSDKQIDLEPNTVATFKENFGDGLEHITFNDDKALTDDWLSVDFLFQLAGDDLAIAGQLPLIRSRAVDTSAEAWQSYLFFAIHLRDRPYTRTELANITREVNKLFLMPAMVIFQHGQTITLSVINRRLNKRYPERDVLEKVTLIKDINIVHPHRAHLEILADLSSDDLYRVYGFTTFEELHQAWQKTLDSSELNKRFFQEVANWYFWAIAQVEFPPGLDGKNSNEMSVIRLITRLIFVWFLKEKGLVSDRLFNPRELRTILKSLEDDESTYYWAILQNLFFATLNQEADKRQFCDNTKHRKGYNSNRLSTNLYRHQDLFRAAAEAEILDLFREIPFLNGGLFECLDEEVTHNGKRVVQRVDGFSRNPKEAAKVPNLLFFQEEPLTIDLNSTYDTKGKRYSVRGLLPILNSYKFTVTENTPIEEEIALDPELLGKVFENLLAAYNPETQTTARKKTGSFYTPREVVDYMVDESLVTYFKTKVQDPNATADELAELDRKLRQLVAFSSRENPFEGTTTNVLLIKAINELRALDPAVGSGAFPMGMLQKLVMILSKLDPDNAIWEMEQRERMIGQKEREIRKDVAIAKQISHEAIRQQAIQGLEAQLAQLEAEFANQDMDYTRKLFLIENCLYGVDIQNIAVQIAKLRCFIALIVEQRVDDSKENRGIFPLPNLEMKFVAANTLFALEKAEQLSLLDGNIELKEKEKELEKLRHEYFQTYDLAKKRRLKERDEALRGEIATLLQTQNVSKSSAEKIAYWKPYDQLAQADFFDPHWMFGVDDGFDIVIGNPPYVRHEKLGSEYKANLKQNFSDIYTGTADLYTYFYRSSFDFLKDNGVLAFITSNKWFKANYGKPLRQFISQSCQIYDIIDFGELSVFDAATFPMIFLAKKGKGQKSQTCFTQVTSLNPPYPDIRALIQVHGAILPEKALSGENWQFSSAGITACLDKMKAAGIPLEKYVNGKIFRGVLTGFNKAFVIDGKTRTELIAQDPKSDEIIKPLAVGDDIRKWHIRESDRWLIFTRRGTNIDDFPVIKNHLMQWYDDLKPKKDRSEKRGRKPGRYKWFEIQDDVAYYAEFDQPKTIYPVIAKEPRFSFDIAGRFTNDKGFIIPMNDLFFLGVLNSFTVWSFLKSLCSVLGNPEQGGRLELRSIYVTQIPIPPASDADKAAITTLVQKCLDAKGQGVAQWEAEIDDRVAHLYGLTPEDLKIIRGE